VGQGGDELVLQAAGHLGGLPRSLQLGARPLLIGHVLPGDQHRLDAAVGAPQRVRAGAQLTAAFERVVDDQGLAGHRFAA
jgi:hypothetical protein